jgi:hypothetical protein
VAVGTLAAGVRGRPQLWLLVVHTHLVAGAAPTETSGRESPRHGRVRRAAMRALVHGLTPSRHHGDGVGVGSPPILL